ncbi:type II secretion system F family protein [Candidatus Sumerlaeota bacterium]|nr:type II secretion system F family protein [Candidatus Sumerlaeota bacterium]
MAKFTYIARDPKGERIEGALEVEDRQAVVTRLQSMGYFPIEVRDTTPRAGGMSLAALRGKVQAGDLANLNRQLADLVGSGVPLVKSLGIILNQMPESLLRDVVSDICKSVQGGDTLARAMQRHPKVFNALSVAMVRAGETGGMLADVLQRLADFAEGEEELRGKVFASLAYPFVMVMAGSVVISILVTVVIPKITSVYRDLNQTLPPITQLLIAITDGIAAYWPAGLLALAVGIVALRRFLRTQEGRMLYDTVVLRIPVLGETIHRRELARFSRTLGNLLHNGVPILSALEITEHVVSNTLIRREMAKLPEAISQGSPMAASLGESALFPPTMVSMVAVGEETAQLDNVLIKVSATFERQVDRSLKTMTSMLEPIIILALGVVVGFIVIAMMLPIMSLDPTQGE